ncbi:hypothetical protein [Acinetobacter chinensis]|uniref:hypothetical protein n=1 Tax=Acinetobacter chinensis TaxID=2004650 RepID=UPI002934D80E|nr:hypothetical protein [Acinetobacter chinensis]WOE40095.1 hypothetical protein QSG87_09230 [Acinetobacter chinensis]
MSIFTDETWQEFVLELRDSHINHVCGTRDPIWIVQELKKTWGIHSDFSDKYKWLVDGESTYSTAQELFDDMDAAVRHEINAFIVEEKELLFNDLDGDEESQDQILTGFAEERNYDWKKSYFQEEWENVQVFATRPDADRFIERQSHNYGQLRVYVESIWQSTQLNNLIQAILNGELKYEQSEGKQNANGVTA